MPPVERFVPRFAAEPPQEELPYGRWEERLRGEFLAARRRARHRGRGSRRAGPDRLVPRPQLARPDLRARDRRHGERLRAVRLRALPAAQREDGEPSDFSAHVDFTAETAERNPDWRLDLCEEAIGTWRGQLGAEAAMTLVWGRPLVSGGRIATAELADLAVDQCELVQERFTLIAPDDYRGDLLEIKLFDVKGTGARARVALRGRGGGRGRRGRAEDDDGRGGDGRRGRAGLTRARTARGAATVLRSAADGSFCRHAASALPGRRPPAAASS